MKNIRLNSYSIIGFIAASCCFTACTKSNNPTTVQPAQSNVTVSTLAGGGVGNPATVTDPIYGQVGIANGTGTAASFDAPGGVAIDAAGNIYIGEAGNHDIRKITPAGVVSTFAGNAVGGAANGIGTAASFSSLQGIAIDAAGNLYVADSGNQMIRKITPDGTVSTFAGTGAMGANNGPAASATFNAPTGVAVDAAGNVYVADFGNTLIRKITAAGIVSTLAGTGARGYNDGPGASATFTSPVRIAVDGSGNVYVSDFVSIRKITPDGVVSPFAGKYTPEDSGTIEFVSTDGKGTAASFKVADGVATDAAGNVYVGDLGSVRKITPDGTVSTLAGGGMGDATDGPGKSASFGILRGIAVNPSGNLVYVSDYSTSLVRKVEIK
jgi:hypothetical protein